MCPTCRLHNSAPPSVSSPPESRTLLLLLILSLSFISSHLSAAHCLFKCVVVCPVRPALFPNRLMFSVGYTLYTILHISGFSELSERSNALYSFLSNSRTHYSFHRPARSTGLSAVLSGDLRSLFLSRRLQIREYRMSS